MDALARNNVTVSGRADGRPMLFAHGFGCDQNMWRHVAPAFADTHRLILLDHVGAGGSDVSAYDRDRYSSLDGYADDLVAVARELDVTGGVLVAHSVSAMMAVLVAAREPDLFTDLVLVSPSPRYVDDGDYTGGFSRADIDDLLGTLAGNFLGWSAATAPVIMGNADHPQLGQELTESFCRMDPAIAAQWARVTFLSDNRADLPAVRARALVLQCSDDPLAPESVGRYVHEHLPNSEFVLMEATGHCPNLSAPGETIAAMKAFL
jgi:sigma-B regulation protein RsbQ